MFCGSKPQGSPFPDHQILLDSDLHLQIHFLFLDSEGGGLLLDLLDVSFTRFGAFPLGFLGEFSSSLSLFKSFVSRLNNGVSNVLIYDFSDYSFCGIFGVEFINIGSD